MLIGQYESKVSNKHQIAFPKKFRTELGRKLIVTKGLEKNLIIVSEKNWKTLLEGTEGKPFISRSAREIQRFLLGNAQEAALDEKGRFVIPQFLIVYAEIKTDVIFAGIDRFVELWDKDLWIKSQDTLSQNIESIAEKMSQKESKNE